MKKKFLLVIFFLTAVVLGGGFLFLQSKQPSVLSEKTETAYWLILYRKSNKEELYKGIPGNKDRSALVKTFVVKTGMPGQRPTPLPQLLDRDYWIITEKHPETENPETAPYFLTLNVPGIEEEPFGPVPYEECDGQCQWVLPGAFGLHGTGGNPTKVSAEDPGSSGCIRHRDEDITYLFEVLDPQQQEIRYYVEDK